MTTEFLHVPFQEVGLKSPYWLDAVPGSPLREWIPVTSVDQAPFPRARLDWWRDRKADREQLVDTWESLNLPLSSVQRKALETLRDPGSVVVVTGQQPGALGGPLYTFAKILTTILYAEKLSRRWKIPVIPVFWNGGDDHDIEEIDRFAWPGSRGEVESFRFDLSAYEERPAWTIPFSGEHLNPALEFMAARHPETEYRAETFRFLESSACESARWTEFFDRFWLTLFAESPLLVIRPWETALREIVGPVIRSEIFEPQAYLSDLRDVSVRLEKRGYPPRIHKKEGLCSFFAVCGGRRLRVEVHGDRFHCKGWEKPLSTRELLSRFDENPGLLSPNALLRPVTKDYLLPTAATVLGPGEIAYQSQIGKIYERHGVPRPAVLRRFSMTLVGRAHVGWLHDLNLSWTDLKRDIQDLAKTSVHSELVQEVECRLQELSSGIDRTEKAIRDLVEADHPGLVQALEAQFGRLRRPVSQIDGLIRRNEAKQAEKVLSRIRKLKGLVFPEGNLQERVYGLVPFLCRFGFEWIGRLMEDAAQWSGSEHIIYVLGGSHD